MRAFRVAAGLAATLMGVPADAAPLPIVVTVNGAPLTFDRPAIERAGRVYVPLRGVFERLGASVVYQAGEINATKGAATIALQVGSSKAAVNGQPLLLDTAPFVQGARTFIPLRFISQALGTTVAYMAGTRTVAITLPTLRRRMPRFPQ